MWTSSTWAASSCSTRDDAAVKAFMAPHTSYVVVIDAHRKVVYTGVGEKQDIEAAIQKANGMMK